MCARWRIFSRPIRAQLHLIDLIVQACVVLHNYLLLTDNVSYIPEGFLDSYSSAGELIEGDWRKETSSRAFRAVRGRPANHGDSAKQTLENFIKYVNSPEGAMSCPWQVEHVTSDGRR